MRTITLRRSALAAAAVVVVAVVAGCGGDDDDATQTADDTATPQQETAVFDQEIQSQLIAVGCYSGAEDGIIGPQTDDAIVAFQQAAGLEVDGELGPATENALDEAVAANETVCATSAGTTTAAPSGTTTTAATTTAATTTAASGAQCTATAITSALGGDSGTTLTSFKCADGYAAGIVSGDTNGFILTASGGTWVAVDTDSVCNVESPEIPLAIEQLGCTGEGN